MNCKRKNQLIGCCGLDCEACDARIATLTNDTALREKTAVQQEVERLYAQGIFSFKESIVRVAELLGINKNTVYMHVRNIRSAEEK